MNKLYDMPTGTITRVAAAVVFLFLLLLTLPKDGLSLVKEPVPLLTQDEMVKIGEKMYRSGVLPSGEEIKGTRIDAQVQGEAFSCVNCHRRSGIGSMEGLLLCPPIGGSRLYKPYYQYNPFIPEPNKLPAKNMMDRPGAKPFYRPAYTDEKLAEVIRTGVNPAGRSLSPVMPHFQISDSDMKILITYLKTLSTEFSPGVTPKEIRFATVIAGETQAGQRKEMLSVLDAVIKNHNAKARKRNKHINLGDDNPLVDAKFNYPFFTLSRWVLTGPPDTWREQLEGYYKKEPVFALLGGISSGTWQPVHEFSEQNKVPCLLPITDLPVVSDNDWYTLYFSKGAWQEGEAAARYLVLTAEIPLDAKVLQVVDDSSVARAVATGFEKEWRDLKRTPVTTISVTAGNKSSSAIIKQALDKERPAVLLLWTSDRTGAILAELAAGKSAPMRVHVSSTLLGKRLAEIPEKARPFTYLSYPYRLNEGKELFDLNARAWLQKNMVPVSEQQISTRLFALTKVFLEPFQVVKRDFNPSGQGNGVVIMEEQSELLMHVKRNYYRDYLLDVISMMSDTNSLAYERVSFGSGQRYISKGCYVVQLSSGSTPGLIKKSDWVIN